MSKKWYVLHTYSGYENKVKKNLETRIETMGLENNVFAIEIPTEMVTEIKEGGRRVESEKKVFPGYVLVRMELDDRSWAAVRNTPGVTGFVGSQGNPAPLTRDEYNKIMRHALGQEPSRHPEEDVLLHRGGAVRQGGFRAVGRVRRRGVGGVPRCRQGEGASCRSSGARPPWSSRSTRSPRFNASILAASRARVDRGFSFDTGRCVDRLIFETL